MMFGNSVNGLAYSWSLHWFFGGLLLMGVILLIVWMVKNLNKKQLMNWILVLIVVGLIGSLVTMRSSLLGWKYMMEADEVEEMMGWDD